MHKSIRNFQSFCYTCINAKNEARREAVANISAPTSIHHVPLCQELHCAPFFAHCAAFCLTPYINVPLCQELHCAPFFAYSSEVKGSVWRFSHGALAPPAPQENTTATLKSGTYHPCLHRVPCIPAGTLSKKSNPAEGVRGRDRMSPPLQPLRRTRYMATSI